MARIGAKFIGRFDPPLNALIALLAAPPPEAEFEAATGLRRHLP